LISLISSSDKIIRNIKLCNHLTMNKLPLTLVLIFCLRTLAFSQSDTVQLTTIAGKLQKLAATRPTEKVYLQFNKPGYIIGDTIWFKGYVTVGSHHQPSALSGVLYVDLIDTKDKIIKTLMLKNNGGVSAGEFVLDSKLPAGDYRVRAYTNWMRNFGPDQFFTQVIPVGDTRTSALLVSPSFAVTNVNNEEIVNTKLAYTDETGRQFINRRVSYQVMADTNLLFAGTGITDATGSLSFTFPGKTAPKQHVRVMSHLKLTKDVTIDKTTPLTVPNENMDIQFFPEGGELVNGVRSRVAFKAIGTNGLGVNIKGIIVDNDNNEVAEFTTQHAGMGVFAITPMPGKTYTAKIMLADNLYTTAKLPAANDKGFVLAVNTDPNDSTKLNVRLTTNEVTLNDMKRQSFYIVGQSGETIYYTTAGKLGKASFSAVIPKSRFPSGIAQFTLFSNTNEPLNERMVFIQNNNDILNLNLATAKQIYTPKEKVSLALNAKENNSKPVEGSFSLSVYKENQPTANENAESTILSNLLLTSDLKGYVEEPNYYFNPNNNLNQIKSDLDVLLLTQGYRRFEWKEVIDDNYPKITYQPEKNLSISGSVTYAKDKPVIKGKVGALSIANNIAVDVLTNEQGKFRLTGFDNLTDTTTMLIQARMANDDKDVNIKLDSKTYPPIFKNNNPETLAVNTSLILSTISNTGISTNIAALSADTTQLAAAIKMATVKVSQKKELKEVIIKERKNAGTELSPWIIVNPRSVNLNGPGHADKVIDAKDMVNCGDFFDCMRNKIPGIIRMVQKKNPGGMVDGIYYNYGDEIDYFARHMGQSLTAPPVIKFMLDGNYVTFDFLKTFNVGDVQTIEVLESVSYLDVYGTAASGGLIIITTKVGNIDPNENYTAKISPGVITTKLSGFYKEREFYVPKYTAININTNDIRTAIYWNPDIVIDSNGKSPVEFFNSDVKGTYRAVVEGIDNDGNIGRYVYRYRVE